MNEISQRVVWTACLLMGLVLAFTISPAAYAETDLDPVVLDVIEMLKAEVDEGVIEQWLQSTDRRPADIDRRGMIALTGAGASEQLISALLRQVEGGVSGQSAAAQPSPGSAEAIILLRAKRAFTEEPEPDWQPEEPWDVYVYLDGEFVAATRPALDGAPVEFRRLIRSGHHELRVILQRYEDLRGGWLYESLSVPILVAFEARGGSPIEIDIEMKRIWGLWRDRRDGGPLTYVIRQGVDVLAENQGTGGNPDRWQPVCEDIEANFADSQTVPKRFRNSMSRCIRWSELWTGFGNSTSRIEILAELAENDFQLPTR